MDAEQSAAGMKGAFTEANSRLKGLGLELKRGRCAPAKQERGFQTGRGK